MKLSHKEILYKSTRSSQTATASQAILKGLADDGGLFAAGENQFEQYNGIKIYAGIGEPIHSDTQKAYIGKL